MPVQGSPDQAVLAKGERSLYTQIFRQFKGVYTKSVRSAMPEDHFFNLENLMPLGDGNLQTVPSPSASLHDFGADSVYNAEYGVVGSTGYLFNFTSTGKIIDYDFTGATATTIATGLSSSGVEMSQWRNQYALFVAQSGYYSWDGTTFSTLSLADGPEVGTDICVYAGRTWVCNGRLILFSAAYDGTTTTDPTNNTAWLASNGAGFINMTDPTLVGNIIRLSQQNGNLYIFGATCVYVLGDIFVPAGASPPTPVFTLQLVQSIVGTDQPASVFPFNRALMFASRYGAWEIQGVNAQRLSEDIDGTWQYLSFSPPVSGGQCVIKNILCAAFLLKRLDDPIFGSNTIIALFFDNKWWFANFGAVTTIATVLLDNVPTLAALIGNKLYTLFTDMSVPPDTALQTPLWDLGDPLSSKVAIQAGIELTTSEASGGSIVATVDGINGSAPFGSLEAEGTVQFVNNVGGLITFVGTGPIVWTVGTYQLYQGSPPGTFSRYIGMSMTSSDLGFQLSSFFMDFKKGARWTAQ